MYILMYVFIKTKVIRCSKKGPSTVVLSYSLWLRRKEVKVSLRFSWLLQPPSFDPLLYSSQRSTTTTTWLVWYTSSNQVLFYQKPTRRTAIFRKGATTTTITFFSTTKKSSQKFGYSWKHHKERWDDPNYCIVCIHCMYFSSSSWPFRLRAK